MQTRSVTAEQGLSFLDTSIDESSQFQAAVQHGEQQARAQQLLLSDQQQLPPEVTPDDNPVFEPRYTARGGFVPKHSLSAEQHAPVAAAGSAQHSKYSSAQGFLPAAAGSTITYPAGAAMHFGSGGHTPAMQKHASGWNDQQQQQAPSRRLVSPPPARPPGLQRTVSGQEAAANCSNPGCKGGHQSAGHHDKPDAAPLTWSPKPNAPWALVEQCKQHCAELRIQPQEPHQVADSRTVRFAGIVLENPSPCKQDGSIDGGEPGGWLLAGMTSSDCQASSAATADGTTTDGALDFEPAAASRRSKSPHSAVPPDHTQPRIRSSDDSIARQAGRGNMQLTLSLTANDLQDATTRLSPKQLLCLDAAPDQAPQVAAAAAGPEVTCPGGSSSGSTAVTDAAGVTAASTGLPDRMRQRLLPDSKQHFEHIAAMIDSFQNKQKHPHLQDGPHSLVSTRAASGSDCPVRIMPQRYADSVGLGEKELAPAAREHVRAVDRPSISRSYGRAQPVLITLAAGSAGEVDLNAQYGFFIIKGDDAYTMYEMMLGRQLLDQVPRFVTGALQQRVYFPDPSKHNLSITHRATVIIGRTSPVHALPGSAATLTDALSVMPACSAVLQDGTTATVGAEPCQTPPQLLQQQQEAATESATGHHTVDKAAAPAITSCTQAQAWGVLAGLLSMIWLTLLILGMVHPTSKTNSGMTLSHILTVMAHSLAVILRLATRLTFNAGEYLGRSWVHCSAAAAAAVTVRLAYAICLQLGGNCTVTRRACNMGRAPRGCACLLYRLLCVGHPHRCCYHQKLQTGVAKISVLLKEGHIIPVDTAHARCRATATTPATSGLDGSVPVKRFCVDLRRYNLCVSDQ